MSLLLYCRYGNCRLRIDALRLALLPVDGEHHIGTDAGARRTADALFRVGDDDGMVPLGIEYVLRQRQNIGGTDIRSQSTSLTTINVNNDETFSHKNLLVGRR